MANTSKSSFHWCELFLNFCWKVFLTDSQNSNSYKMLHQVIIITVLFKKMDTLFQHIQGVPGRKDLTSGECSFGQTIPI